MAVDFSGQISRNRKVLVPDDKCRCNDKYDSCGDGKISGAPNEDIVQNHLT